MEQRASKIKQMQDEFTKMKQCATELQMYVGLREIEKATSQTAKYIDDLEREDHFNERNLEVNISSGLKSILQDIKSFGDININNCPSTLCVKAERKGQAQHLVKNIPGIEKIKPLLLRTLTIPNNMQSLNITACLALPNGKFMILDLNKFQLLMFSNNGIFIRKVMSFSTGPVDACFVRNDIVAVAFGIKNQTAVVDVERNKIIQTIKLPHISSAVASDGQILAISAINDSTIVNLNDMSHTILQGVGANYSAVFKGNIYGIIQSENNICCYKKTGEPLWTFQHDIDILGGLALDKNGFVYIVSRGDNGIVVVSPDGKTCKTILLEDDGINFPDVIDINKETEMMIVSGQVDDGSRSYYSAFVYKI
ncbi:uncharacterized protein LOC127739043 [Mytilus californianus]|uniref:uncharacterized protein LOC127739043 n=1 Tax=Mytilus californianus TaxID=6549 RepID=UPI002247D696|nr:uncharacterized protein LOC127739043 [Mytilus californianus]XP_052106565.1 uncharacterized protein LOC127739043 [Mytilus californianus]